MYMWIVDTSMYDVCTCVLRVSMSVFSMPTIHTFDKNEYM